MKLNTLHIGALLPVVFAMLVGCATTETVRWYEGDARPAGDVAILVVPNEVEVLAIDGEKAALSTSFTAIQERRIELLPGNHIITARYYMPDDYDKLGERNAPPDRSPPVDLRFTAAQGDHYAVTYTIGSERIDITINQVDQNNTAHAVSETVTPKASAPAVNAPVESDTLTTLQQTWRQATPEERKSFRKWIIDAP